MYYVNQISKEKIQILPENMTLSLKFVEYRQLCSEHLNHIYCLQIFGSFLLVKLWVIFSIYSFYVKSLIIKWFDFLSGTSAIYFQYYLQSLVASFSIYKVHLIKRALTNMKRWWCNCYHGCLPSNRSGFDSRLSHFTKFFIQNLLKMLKRVISNFLGIQARETHV